MFIHTVSTMTKQQQWITFKLRLVQLQCLLPLSSPQYQCCGADSYRDWARPGAWHSVAWGRGSLVPDSCCKSPAPGCGARDHPSNIHYTGCRHRSLANVTCKLLPRHYSHYRFFDEISVLLGKGVAFHNE